MIKASDPLFGEALHDLNMNSVVDKTSVAGFFARYNLRRRGESFSKALERTRACGHLKWLATKKSPHEFGWLMLDFIDRVAQPFPGVVG